MSLAAAAGATYAALTARTASSRLVRHTAEAQLAIEEIESARWFPISRSRPPQPPESRSCGQRDAARVAREAGSRYNLKRTADPMLTSAITAAIAAVLTWLGIPPGPYIAGVWIAVKILVVALAALLGWRAARRRSHAAPPPAGGGG